MANRRERRREKKLSKVQDEMRSGITTIRDPRVTDDMVAKRIEIAKAMLPGVTKQGASALAEHGDEAVLLIFDQADEQGAALAVVFEASAKGTKGSEAQLQMLVPGVVADARRQAAAGKLVGGGVVLGSDAALQLLDQWAPSHARAIRTNLLPPGTNACVIFAASGVSLRTFDRSTGRMIGV